MVYDNNEGPIYSSLVAKTCSQYCAANGYYSLCSDTATSSSPGTCFDDEGVDCFTVNGRYCCCGL
jgi:hypothetical protein